MPSSDLDFAPARFSTEALPTRNRISAWREFAREVVCVDIAPLAEPPFECEAMLRALPGLRTVSWASSAARFERTPEIVAKGADTFGLVINCCETMTAMQRNREIPLGAGDAALLLHSEPAALVQSPGRGLCLVLPRAALAPLVPQIEDAATRPIPHQNDALRLLLSYEKVVREDLALVAPELRNLTITHIHDLVAMLVGATGDGAAVAEGRGVAAARLAVIKADIVEHLDQRHLSLVAVAARQQVTPRYIQKLFEREGITFSEFVLEQRLARVHLMLSDPRMAGRTVSAIAYGAGFGDLSHFNRVFRARYGARPSDVRAAARPS
jgi:AraC-like DNA-binding protein